MPAEIRWANREKTILIVTFCGDIPRDEFLSIFSQEVEMFDEVDHTAYLIADFRQIGKMSVDILGLTSAITRTIPTNLGGIVYIGSSTTLQTVFAIWSKIYRKMVMVSTMEQAREWITEMMSDPGKDEA